jgi:hypothetical protein
LGINRRPLSVERIECDTIEKLLGGNPSNECSNLPPLLSSERRFGFSGNDAQSHVPNTL